MPEHIQCYIRIVWNYATSCQADFMCVTPAHHPHKKLPTF